MSIKMGDTPETDANVQRVIINGLSPFDEYCYADDAREIERKFLTLRDCLEYIANAGISARHCEDEARKALALIDPNNRYQEPGEEVDHE